MQITITWQTVITASAVMAAIVAICAYFAKVVRWVDKQKQQDLEIASLKTEMTLQTYGIMACLKGLKEQGCDGPVSEALDKIEKHINKQAHK